MLNVSDKKNYIKREKVKFSNIKLSEKQKKKLIERLRWIVRKLI